MDAGVKTKKPGAPLERARKGEPSAQVAIKSVGVIGAGQMGNGIAQVCAGRLRRRPDRRRARRRSTRRARTIERNMARQVSRGMITDAEMQAALTRITHRAPTMEPFGEADLVIEAAIEDEAVKRKIFTDLCPKLKKDAIIATNTSSISDHPAGGRDRPARALHRHPLHEPGADDAAGRADPRHRHRGGDLRGSPGASSRRLGKTSPVRRTSRPSSSTASCCR